MNKAENAFSNLTREQLNWKPTATHRSIAECLDHLIIADRCYFDDLKAISSGTYRMSFWERYNPLSNLLGRALRDQMKEQVDRKMTTHQKLEPASSSYDQQILDYYENNLSQFMKLVSLCHDVDIDKLIITSPTISWITYSLRYALEFLFEHEHRHINQAVSVKEDDRFPEAS